MNKTTATFFASVIFAGSAFAQGGDDCTVPTALTAFGTVGFDTTVATTSGFDGGGTCAGGASTINQDLFWVFTAPATGDIQFDTDGSTFDTKISVHLGNDCSATCADYDDDGGVGLQSLVQLTGIASGTQILVQVGGFGGNSGTGLLNITQYVDPCSTMVDDSLEDNDLCTSPVNVTAGFTPGLFVSTGDLDYYRITVQADEVLTAVANNTTLGAADVAIYDAACNPVATPGFGTATYSTLGAAGPVDLIVEVSMDGFSSSNCTNYDLELSVAPDLCAASIDDAFEDNDTCATAVAVAPGSYIDLFASLTDGDFYSIVLQPDEVLDFNCSNDLNADVDLSLYDASCNLQQTFNTDSLSTSNVGGAGPITVIVEVFVDSTSANSCTNYDLDVIISLDPCSTLMADALEENDDCASAVVLGDGFYSALTVFDNDNDFYAVGVDPGGTLTLDIFFLQATADVDIYLWDPAIACDTNVVGTGATTGFLDRGFSASDDEQVIYTNTTGAPQNLIVEVDMYTVGGCNSYDLMIAGANGMGGGVGSNYCMSGINSTGVSSVMGAMGSRVVANNDVTLTASDLPRFSFGFFIVSRVQGFVQNPAGSAGNLCLGGAIGRYVGPGQIMNSGTLGEIVLPIDLTAIPQPLGAEPVVSGDQWSFQLWHRDSSPAGPTSNFTDGLQIDFI